MKTLDGGKLIKLFLTFSLILGVQPLHTSALIDTDVKYGDSGSSVRELQKFLINQHFLVGTPTGNFFGLTKSALKKYQQSAGIPSTGYVGPRTRAAINKALTDGTPSSNNQTSASSSVDSVTSVTLQIQQLINQVASLRNGTRPATSSIIQAYATSTTPVQFDSAWSKAVVNLFCTDRYGGYKDFSSGTGVIIDPRGVILTNAHVAYNFLFANWPNPSLEECYVRVGSPAANEYTATLMYIPEAYVRNELKYMFSPATTTDLELGKKDYALLLITGHANPVKPLETTFPYLSLYQGQTLPVHTPVYLLGYAAENFGPDSILRDLHLLSTAAQVDAQRPIDTNTVPDVIAFSGTINAQHGASGGSVITGNGQVAALITFLDEGYGDTTDQRVLNAITSGYVLRDFASDNGVSLSTFLSNPDLFSLAKKFNTDKAAQYQKDYTKNVRAKGFVIPGVN